MVEPVLNTLWVEVRKDVAFFSFCGLTTGFLMVVQTWLDEIGISPKLSWPDELFSGFVSLSVFGLVFVGLLGLGAFVTCLLALQIRWYRLEQVVAHLETRFAQLTSSIICFTSGLAISSVSYSFYTSTGTGALLALLIIGFNFFLIVGYMSASIVARRHPPFDRWYAGLGMLFAACGVTMCGIMCGMQ